MKNILSAAIVMSLCAPNLYANAVPNDVKINGVTAEGNGCPSSKSYSVNISPDKKAFLISFSEFNATLEPNEDELPGISSKECLMTLDISFPIGWQYTISKVNYRGHVELDAGVNASFITHYSFLGQGYVGISRAFTLGPYVDDFVQVANTGMDDPAIDEAWSPCFSERPLFIKPTIEIKRSKNATALDGGYLTAESADSDFEQKYYFAWRQCGQ